MVFYYRQAEQSYIYIKWYIKDRKGAKKQIYNKADNTSTFIALHLVDILVKYKQANKPLHRHPQQMDNKIQVFPYLRASLRVSFK